MLSYELRDAAGGRKRVALDALERTLVQNREALQKAVLVRLTERGGKLLVLDRQNQQKVARFFEGFLDSLESARAAYAAYVKSGSRETLKALADLRKAVVEETQRVSQRAQDLAGALWKDLTVAAAPFVLKILADAAKTSSQSVAGGLALAAAVFLVFSFCIQVHINRRYLRGQKAARAVWRNALNSVLSPAEVEEFSDRPIDSAVRDYRRVHLLVGGFYVFLVIALLTFAAQSLAPVASADVPAQPAGIRVPK